MSTDQRRRLGHLVTGAAVLLLTSGAAVVGVGIWSNQNPPPPPGSAAIPTLSATAVPTPAAPTAPNTAPTAPPSAGASPTLSRSIPTRIRSPPNGVDSSLMQLGLTAHGALQVPPYDKNAPAGWYRGSPTPGQLGPAVILGHV
ncbi:MAG: hypothetical protein QOC59_40, partial [Microbacteriaceae bacterium]|nr:hypothetical protein [Microbacteriaceae bacterium]